jgi:hypothetical protein
MVLTRDPLMADPVFERFSMQPCTNAELFKMWGRFFSPLGDPQSQIPVAFNWTPFFTGKLLNDSSFSWAKSFLTSKAWPLIQGDVQRQGSLMYNLPFECPKVLVECCESSDAQSAPSTLKG